VAKLVHEGEHNGAAHQVFAPDFVIELIGKALEQLVAERDLPDIRIVGGVRLGAMRGIEGDVLGDSKRIVEANRDRVEEMVRDQPGAEIFEFRSGGPVGRAETA
jgi:hypothetical protein